MMMARDTSAKVQTIPLATYGAVVAVMMARDISAKVLMIRSVEMAMAYKVRLVVRSTFDDPEAPQVAPDGTPRQRPSRSIRTDAVRLRPSREQRYSTIEENPHRPRKSVFRP